jgi:hypothetical protein
MSVESRSAGRSRHGRSRRLLWVRYGRACRALLLLAATACALAGALTASPYVVLVIAPACGLFVAGVVAVHVVALEGRTVDPVRTTKAHRAVLLSGGWAALLPPAAAGIRTLDDAGVMVVVVLVFLAASVGAGGIVEICQLSSETPEGGWDEEELRQLLRVLPTSMLLSEWHSGCEYVHSAKAHEARIHAAQVRGLLLEELSRRDPAGVGRWLSEGDEERPEQYVRGDSAASP